MQDLSPEEVQAGLGTAFVGQNVVWLPETGSTNDITRCLAQAGAPEGTLVVTDCQTAGRGRLGRRWQAPPGSSLLLSLLFRPSLAAQQVQQLTMVCGLALVDAVESETGLRVGLKWPNDVVVSGAKAGGILTEIELQGDRLAFAIVGIGLNVNLDPAWLAGDLLVRATSLSYALGREVPRLSLLQALLRAVERRYLRLREGESPHAEWASRLVTLGRMVTANGGRGLVTGIAEGVNPDGALLVRLADGQLETVLAGDVTLQSPA